jgi:hypothetical protein
MLWSVYTTAPKCIKGERESLVDISIHTKPPLTRVLYCEELSFVLATSTEYIVSTTD